MTVLGVVALVALVALSMLLSIPLPEEPAAIVSEEPAAVPVSQPELQQPAWIISSLDRCKAECNARSDLALDGTSYCHARCETAYR